MDLDIDGRGDFLIHTGMPENDDWTVVGVCIFEDPDLVWERRNAEDETSFKIAFMQSLTEELRFKSLISPVDVNLNLEYTAT